MFWELKLWSSEDQIELYQTFLFLVQTDLPRGYWIWDPWFYLDVRFRFLILLIRCNYGFQHNPCTGFSLFLKINGTHCVLLQIKKIFDTYTVSMSIPGWLTVHRITYLTSVSISITITTPISRSFKTTSSSPILHRLGCPIFYYLICDKRVNSLWGE